MYRRFLDSFKANGGKPDNSLQLPPINRSTVLTSAANEGGIF